MPLGSQSDRLRPVRLIPQVLGLMIKLHNARSPLGPPPPLAFGPRQAEHLHMTPRAQNMKPTAGAVRASKAIQQNAALLKSLPEIIDRETGVRETLDILQSIVEQAGDLIESRSPELLAAARAALTRYKDEAIGEAE
jgi:hypothetical protein